MSNDKHTVFNMAALFKEIYGDDVNALFNPDYGSATGPMKSGQYWFKGKEYTKDQWEVLPAVIEFRRKQLMKELIDE